MKFPVKLVCHSALFASLGLPTTVLAEDKPFLGFGLGGGSIALEVEAESAGESFSDEDTEGAGAVTIKGGTDRANDRGYLIYKALPYEDAVVSMLGVSHDWKFHEGPWRPYFGLTVGLAMLRWTEDLEINDQFTAELEDETARSFALGLQGGFLYEASDNLNFEISLRAVGTSLETELEIQDSGMSSGRVTQEVNAMSSFSVGANFMF